MYGKYEQEKEKILPLLWESYISKHINNFLSNKNQINEFIETNVKGEVNYEERISWILITFDQVMKENTMKENTKSSENNNNLKSCGFCQCTKCDNGQNLLQCGKCKNVYYCSRKCQSVHWEKHKILCIKKN